MLIFVIWTSALRWKLFPKNMTHPAKTKGNWKSALRFASKTWKRLSTNNGVVFLGCFFFLPCHKRKPKHYGTSKVTLLLELFPQKYLGQNPREQGCSEIRIDLKFDLLFIWVPIFFVLLFLFKEIFQGKDIDSEKVRVPDGIWTHDPPWSSRML